MSYSKMIDSNSFLDDFKKCTQLQYNGKLEVNSSKGHQWNFYYRLGRIAWATGGINPCRRLRRLMALHCPLTDIDKLQLRSQDISTDAWDYHLLECLYKKQKIQREQIQAIVEQTISELLFDLAQKANFTSISCTRSQAVILETPVSFTSMDMSMKYVVNAWKAWSEAGLANFSPELAPVLRRPEQLRQLVSPSAYSNFEALINGKYTLRDIAMLMKREVLPVTRSLLPYILKGIIELVEVVDLPFAATLPRTNSNSIKPKSQTAPLIACVDDSPLVCKMLEEIVTAKGLRFLKIQNAVEALPTLIQHKPDLIFLDLVMPIASGYEICTQLRRISAFANTPVVILTGNDGLLDRVRAKVVGSTDFISKPIVADRVMSTVRKYLPLDNLNHIAVSS